MLVDELLKADQSLGLVHNWLYQIRELKRFRTSVIECRHDMEMSITACRTGECANPVVAKCYVDSDGIIPKELLVGWIDKAIKDLERAIEAEWQKVTG